MKISELIKKLKALKKEYGDLPVTYYDGDMWIEPLPSVNTDDWWDLFDSNAVIEL